MKLKFLAPAVATAAAALIAATPPASADPGEEYMLQMLRKTNQKWWWPGQEPYIVGLGYRVCDDWAAGRQYWDVVNANIGPPRWWTQRSARFFVTLSTRALCPQHFLTRIPSEEHQFIEKPPPHLPTYLPGTS